MYGLPCVRGQAADQPAHILSQTASVGATDGFSTSEMWKHRLSLLACRGGFSACPRHDARSGFRQWMGCRVVSLFAASASNHPTSYETDRNGRSPIAVKR